MKLQTTTCSDHGHPEFAIEFDSEGIPEEHGRELVETIEEMVAEGSVFRPGETFAIGWMITKIESAEDGTLTLCEPDLNTNPLEYRAGVSETLRIKMIQVFTADSYGIDRDDLMIPTIGQLAVACNRVPEADAILLARNDDADPDDSGWFVLCHDDDHDHEAGDSIGVVPLHELARVRPDVINFMMFPTGCTLLLEAGVEPVVLRDDERLELEKGSFFDQLLTASGVTASSDPD